MKLVEFKFLNGEKIYVNPNRILIVQTCEEDESVKIHFELGHVIVVKGDLRCIKNEINEALVT